jgi:hypothetical protein
MTVNKLQTWIPMTDVEVEELLNNQLRAMSNNKGPRPLSLVRFAEDSSFRKYKSSNNEAHFKQNYSNLLYLGAVPNQYGHGAYVNLKFNTIHVIDIEELVELTEDET